MKYIKTLLITLTLFAGMFFYDVNDIKACIAGDAGYPGCLDSTPSQTSKPSNYPSDAGGCSSYCQNTYPSSPGSWATCTSDCTNSFKPVKSYEACVNECNNTSNADKSSCLNACEVTSEKPVSTPKETPTPTPTLNMDEDVNFYKPLAGGYVCGGMMSAALRDELVKIYKTISLIMVVAVVIFGMLDFFKAVSAGDADTMKKVTKKFTNRLIIVILIAILPVVLQLLLTLFGNDSMKNCLEYFK